MNLQQILQTQQLPLDQIQMIRNQVSLLRTSAQPNLPVRQPEISMNGKPAIPPGALSQLSTLLQQQAPSLSVPSSQSPIGGISTPQPIQGMPSPHTQQPNLDLSSLLASNNLANILASASRSTNSPVPQNSQLGNPPIPNLSTLNPPPTDAIPSTGGESNSLLASLRAAGILVNPSATPVNGHTPTVSNLSLAPANDVKLASASLKMYVPFRYPTHLTPVNPSSQQSSPSSDRIPLLQIPQPMFHMRQTLLHLGRRPSEESPASRLAFPDEDATR